MYTEKRTKRKKENQLNLVKKVGNGHFGIGLYFNRYLSHAQLHRTSSGKTLVFAANIYVSIKKLFITVYF